MGEERPQYGSERKWKKVGDERSPKGVRTIAIKIRMKRTAREEEDSRRSHNLDEQQSG